MGERLLQVGLDDPRVAGALAAKVGLSGHAVFVVGDEGTAEKARAAAASSGALVDVHVSALDSLPFPERTFDLVVVNSKRGQLASLEPSLRTRALGEFHRVLRTGGRLVIVETGTRSGLAMLFRSRATSGPALEAGGVLAALQGARFTLVRPLGDREGYRFTEGLKSR